MRKHEESAGQIKAFARRAMTHLVGTSLTKEDIEQEMWVVWCNCCEKFREDGGASFSTYLSIAMQKRMISIRTRTYRSSGLWHGTTIPGVEDETLIDRLEDETQNQERDLIEAETHDLVEQNLDPRVARVLEFVKDPPDFIEQQLEAVRAKNDVAESMGLGRPHAEHLTLKMALEILDISRGHFYRLLEQSKDKVQKYV